MSTISGVGIWSGELRYHGDAGVVAEAAAELEALGYSAVWLPDVGGDLFGSLDHLLGATSTMTVASGVLNVWRHDPTATAAWWAALDEDRRSRTMLGLGVSHASFIGDAWARPLATMRGYLDGLDAGGVPAEHRCLAALGPKMLELARDRTAGAHPYLVTPEHTAVAREALGAGLLAVEQGVVLDTDSDRARATARQALDVYFGLPNYVNNWLRLGYTREDVDSRSDRLVDALVAWGAPDTIAERVHAHRAAGADHVCIQVLRPFDGSMDRGPWRELAPALTRS
jgi:probable F420-dependent oxidoreductase